jgi:hypothetical protein
MKKLFALAFALVFSTGIAFAQDNNSSITQDGDDNSATVEQTGSANSATVLQGFDGQGQSGAEAMIKQVGADNMATIKQRAWGGRDNDHTVTQTGSENSASIDAFNGANTGSIIQTGDLNQGKIQHGAAKFGRAEIEQNGDENWARARQFRGDGNVATIKQGVPVYVSNDNYGDIRQEGNGNNASFKMQAGDDNDVVIDQLGDNNYSEYFVKYGDANDIDVTVEGTSNRTRLSINASWGSRSSGNMITVEKDGDTNYLAGSIEGDGNTVDVFQDGSNNRVGTDWYIKDGVNITGDSNMVDVMQNGSGHMSTTMINGNNNTATVMQSN